MHYKAFTDRLICRLSQFHGISNMIIKGIALGHRQALSDIHKSSGPCN